MRKRRLPFFTILSLVLMLLTIASWIRGYWAVDIVGPHHVRWTPDSYDVDSRCLLSGGGIFALSTMHNKDSFPGFRPETWVTLTPDAQARLTRFRAGHPDENWYFASYPVGDLPHLVKQSLIGFEFSPMGPGEGYWITIPAWLLVAILAILPFRYLLRRQKISPPPVTPRLAIA